MEQVDRQLFGAGIKLAESLLERFKRERIEPKNAHQEVLLFFFRKAHRTFRAVELLWRNEYSEDAYTLARSIYEIRLQSIYIGGDPPKRSKQFMDHFFKAGLGTLQIIKRHFPNERKLHEWEANLRKAAGQERVALLNDPIDAERATKKKWWGSGIKQLLEKLDADRERQLELEGLKPLTSHEKDELDAERKRRNLFQREYEVIYHQLSDVAHSGPLHMHRYTKPSRSRAEASRPTVPWSSFDWLSQIIGWTARAFEMNFDDAVDRAQRKARETLLKKPKETTSTI